MSEKLLPCPVETYIRARAGLETWRDCAECPNRAPSQEEAEMREDFKSLAERFKSERFIYGADWIETVLAKYQKGGAT